jgi:hypothetical protein
LKTDIGEDTLEVGLVDEAEAGTTESLEDVGEEVAEGAIESATMSSLAATGIGIFIAVGIDVVFGAINGAKEKEQLQDLIDQMQAKLDLVNKYLDQIQVKSTSMATDCIAQMDIFKAICKRMLEIFPANHQPPAWNWNIPSTMDNLDKLLAAQSTALDNFVLLTQLRSTYAKAVANNRNHTKVNFSLFFQF